MPQSLQCPHCQGSVTVADEAAGQRVRCPHCRDTFLAPGIAATTHDDDDWLELDTPAVQHASAANAPTDASKQPVATPASADSDDIEDEFRLAPLPSSSGGRPATSSGSPYDDDDFTSLEESPPPPQPGIGQSSGTTNAGPTVSQPSASESSGKAGEGSTGAPPAMEPEYATEYRVKCNICGTYLYAKAKQAGKTVKCTDCHSPITIPPPPKVKEKPKIPDIEDAETFALQDVPTVDRGPDPFRKSANELLEEAEREELKEQDATYYDTPDVAAWAKGVFGIFTDISVVAHWLALSALGAVPAMIAFALDVPILIMGLFPAGFFLAVMVVSCGFAIMHSVANGESQVSDWPTMDPGGWLSQLFTVIAAAMVAAVPAWVFSMIVLGPGLASVAMTMFSIYILFPFVLLSMLDMNSAFAPFSSEVARSVRRCEEAWGGFYFSSGLLFVALYFIYLIGSMMERTSAAAITIAATVAVTFAYFSLLGRLANAIGQAINAPPRKDHIDRARPADTT